MFTTVLVANRGEIACRVIGTLRRLGMRSVAVHTDADAGARHVREADVAVRLGVTPTTPPVVEPVETTPTPVVEPVETTSQRLGGGGFDKLNHRATLDHQGTLNRREGLGNPGAPSHRSARAAYLDVDAVVGAAAAIGAEAIHPGYGFLSESPALARACERTGLTFVGPPVRAIELMADKLAAKRLVAAHGVPVLPGTLDGAALAVGVPASAVVAAAREVGFPLLVKPAAGGGGKGMVVVGTPESLPAAIESARRVASSSFGDDTLLLERLVDRPRHIEVQVLADAQGAVVHLGERECTLQRRFQKVVEEAPSPALDDATRARLGEAACEVARSVGYVGAGTVEFLVPADDPTSFWFIEMNTRLQVEHPVTEMVTGIDLVELQLRVAAGEPLPFAQRDVRVAGHAVEARLYAEAPSRGFLPATGRVLRYDDAGVAAGPAAKPLRLDSSLAEGTEVTGDFDPLLAKAVAFGADRAQALDRLDALLASVTALGVDTNQGFLRDLLADDDVRAGHLDTGLIDRLVASRTPTPRDPSLLLAAAFLTTVTPTPTPATAPTPASRAASRADRNVQTRSERASHRTFRSRMHVPIGWGVAGGVAGVGALGPWAGGDGWRLNAPPVPRRVVLVDDTGAEHVVPVSGSAEDAAVILGDDGAVTASVRAADRPGTWLLTVDDVTHPVHAAATFIRRDGVATVWVGSQGRVCHVTVLDRAEQAARRRAARSDDGNGAGNGGGRDGGDGRTATGTVEVRAAMPGTVSAVPIADGDIVAPGTTVVVVEAMKMEHPLIAAGGGAVHLRVRPGDQVRVDQVVAVVAVPTDSTDSSGATDSTISTRDAEPTTEPRAARPVAHRAPSTRGAT